jgi:hypothetical protein
MILKWFHKYLDDEEYDEEIYLPAHLYEDLMNNRFHNYVQRHVNERKQKAEQKEKEDQKEKEL